MQGELQGELLFQDAIGGKSGCTKAFPYDCSHRQRCLKALECCRFRLAKASCECKTMLDMYGENHWSPKISASTTQAQNENKQKTQQA